MKRRDGFVLATVLILLLIISSLGTILLTNSSTDFKFAGQQIGKIQAEEIARSGLAYYSAYGIPPRVNGQPMKLYLFPEKDRTLEIARVGDAIRFTGTLWNGTEIRARASYIAPIWDPESLEKAP